MLGLRSLIHKASSVVILVSSNYAKFFVENPVSSDSVANQKETMSSLGRLNPLREMQVWKFDLYLKIGYTFKHGGSGNSSQHLLSSRVCHISSLLNHCGFQQHRLILINTNKYSTQLNTAIRVVFPSWKYSEDTFNSCLLKHTLKEKNYYYFSVTQFYWD